LWWVPLSLSHPHPHLPLHPNTQGANISRGKWEGQIIFLEVNIYPYHPNSAHFPWGKYLPLSSKQCSTSASDLWVLSKINSLSPHGVAPHVSTRPSCFLPPGPAHHCPTASLRPSGCCRQAAWGSRSIYVARFAGRQPPPTFLAPWKARVAFASRCPPLPSVFGRVSRGIGGRGDQWCLPVE
jgi:hypothetical protein